MGKEYNEEKLEAKISPEVKEQYIGSTMSKAGRLAMDSSQTLATKRKARSSPQIREPSGESAPKSGADSGARHETESQNRHRCKLWR